MSRFWKWLGMGCGVPEAPNTDLLRALHGIGERIDEVTDALRRVNYEAESGNWTRDMIVGKYRPHTPRATRTTRKRSDDA